MSEGGDEFAERGVSFFLGDLTISVGVELSHEYFKLFRHCFASELVGHLVRFDYSVSILIESREQFIDHCLYTRHLAQLIINFY